MVQITFPSESQLVIRTGSMTIALRNLPRGTELLGDFPLPAALECAQCTLHSERAGACNGKVMMGKRHQPESVAREFDLTSALQTPSWTKRGKRTLHHATAMPDGPLRHGLVSTADAPPSSPRMQMANVICSRAGALQARAKYPNALCGASL